MYGVSYVTNKAYVVTNPVNVQAGFFNDFLINCEAGESQEKPAIPIYFYVEMKNQIHLTIAVNYVGYVYHDVMMNYAFRH